MLEHRQSYTTFLPPLMLPHTPLCFSFFWGLPVSASPTCCLSPSIFLSWLFQLLPHLPRDSKELLAYSSRAGPWERCGRSNSILWSHAGLRKQPQLLLKRDMVTYSLLISSSNPRDSWPGLRSPHCLGGCDCVFGESPISAQFQAPLCPGQGPPALSLLSHLPWWEAGPEGPV